VTTLKMYPPIRDVEMKREKKNNEYDK